jgi:PST family polysaccharide transporter
MNLRIRTARSVRISLATTIASTMAQALAMAALARLLSPAEYGLAAAALVIVKPVQQLLLLGLEQSAVLQTDLPPRAIPSLFWISICAALAGCVGIIVALWLIPGIPEDYRAITIAFSFLLPASAIAIAPRAVMRRDLAFGKISIAEFVAVVVGFGGVGIVAAAAGCGAFSLVYGYVGQALLRSAISCALCPGFPPRWDFEISQIRPIFSFGIRVTKVSVLETLHIQVAPAFIAFYFGWAALGQFNQALMLITLPILLIAASVTKVVSTSFRMARHDLPQLEDVCRTLVENAAAVTLPICFGIAAAATPLVKVVLGPQWSEAARIIPWISLGAACNCLAMLFAVMNEAVGRLEAKMIIQGVVTATLGVLLFFAVQAGLERCAQVYSVVALFYLACQIALSKRVLHTGIATMARWIAPGLQCSALVVAFILGMQTAFPHLQAVPQTALDVMGAAVILSAFYTLLHPRLLRQIFERAGLGEIVPV